MTAGAIGATNLEHLRACAIWVPVKIIPKRGKPGKTDKVPVNAGGYNIDAQNPANCMSWWEADLIRQSLPGDTGVGLVMHPGSGLFCVDLDDCIVPVSPAAPRGGLTDLALGMIEALPGVLMERSHSGRGLHLWGYAALGDHRTRSDRVPGLEVYTSGRFILVTGDMPAGWMDDHSNALGTICSALFGEQAPAVPFDWTDTGAHDAVPDDEIIRRVRAHRMRGSEKNGRMLWDGDTDEIAAHYPSSTGDAYDGSGADLALATLLMHCTGNNAERSSRLLCESGLARDKHEREDYMRWTIERAYRPELRAPIRPETLPWAAAPFTGVWNNSSQPVDLVDDKSAPAQAAEPAPWSVPKWGPDAFLGRTDLAQHFAGCVYVNNRDQIYAPDGYFYSERQFNSMFGGNGLMFVMSADNKVTRKAWEAFLHSSQFDTPKVGASCFLPDEPPGAIVGDAINTWRVLQIRTMPGDPEPWLSLLRKQIPDERDQRILLSWMAACVQHREKKFRWSPFIQGLPGNGKTTHMSVIDYCIGAEYACRPRSDMLGKQFNSMLDRKLFAGVDDVHVTMKMWAVLKPMITETVNEVEHKGVDSSTVRGSVVKYMLTGNDKDGLPYTRDNRRIAPFFTAHQELDDLERDGIDEEYLDRLYKWLAADGYAIVAHFLMHYPIDPQFNPASKCQRAPFTSSTEEAIKACRSGIARHVQDAVEITGELAADGTVSHSQMQFFYRKHGVQMPDVAECNRLLRELGFLRHGAGAVWKRINS